LESVEVQIGKRKLKLKGEPELINSSADKLNLTIKMLSENDSIKGDTLLILAGLNLAEDNILKEKEHQEKINSLNQEVDELNSYLETILAQS
jgi:cell division protein ZapA (FtsZ GTPase activity inhibitor)